MGPFTVGPNTLYTETVFNLLGTVIAVWDSSKKAKLTLVGQVPSEFSKGTRMLNSFSILGKLEAKIILFVPQLSSGYEAIPSFPKYSQSAEEQPIP